MKELLEIARNAREKTRDSEDRLSSEDKDRVITEILKLSKPNFDKFFKELFADGIGECGENFYRIIYNLQLYIGFREKSDSVFSKLWVHAYQEIESTSQQEAFLNELANDSERHIWDMQSSLPAFCEMIELPSEFAANWFHKLAEKVKNDLAGQVNDAVESYTISHPSSALDVLKIYETQLADETIRGLGGFILGLLRNSKKKEIQEVDIRLKSSKDVNGRVCYYNSIFFSYKTGVLTLDQLSASLEQMLNDDCAEVNDLAFWTVNRGLIVDKDSFYEFGITWFNKHCSPSISDDSKYHVMSCVQHICRDIKGGGIEYKSANEIIGKVLPFFNGHFGTLDQLNYYLCDRIKNSHEFQDTIFEFVECGIEIFLCLFEHERFRHFRNELGKVDLTYLITELIFSGDCKKCKFGFLLLENSKFTPYTAKTLVKVKEEDAFMALKQLVVDRSYNQTIAKKVQFLEPFFRNVCIELQSDFMNEVIIQAVNYWGGCYKELKSFARSKLLKTIIAKAENYFENITKAQDSPANSFNFPGYKEACVHACNRRNAQIQKHARENSIFNLFGASVHLIYGNKFCALVEGNVGDATPMAYFEKSMELPRLELIDPEGMAIRRLNTHGR